MQYIVKNKYIFLVAVLYIFFFAQMQLVYFYGDDFQVLYPIHGSRNFFDILNFCINKMSWFWNNWSGRVVGHFTVSFGLSFWGIQFYRIVNPVMVFIVLFLSLKIFDLFRKIDIPKYLFFLSFIIIGLNINISRESLYWSYGGILYIWGFTLTLFVIYIVCKYYLKDKEIPLILKVTIFVSCILQTFILEQLAFITISFLVLMIYFSFKNNRNCKYLIVLLLVTLSFFLISTFSPGNANRTLPLKLELTGISVPQIMLCKLHGFFTVLFNPDFYGIYVGLILILLCRNYLKTSKNSFLSKLPVIFAYSYFIILFLYKIFNFNILLFYGTDNFDIFELKDTNLIILILINVYYLLLVISSFVMLFMTVFRQNKFLFYSVVITFVSSLIPIICIRYIGIRYCLYFLISLILLGIYFTMNFKSGEYKLIDLIFVIISVAPKNILVIAMLFLMFLYFINRKSSLYFIKGFILILILFNLINIYYGYRYNSKIYVYNDIEMAQRYKINDVIMIKEIPYKYSKYSWHSKSLDFVNKHIYYGYLDQFYDEYYDIDISNIVIMINEEDINH